MTKYEGEKCRETAILDEHIQCCYMAKIPDCVLNRNQIKISMEWFECTKKIFFKSRR